MGQVVDAAGKKPIAGAIVTISGGNPVTTVLPTGEVIVSSPGAPGTPAPDAPRQLLTGSQGQFMFRALTAGRYQIRVTAPGYLGGGYGQNRPAGSSQSVELAKDDEKRGDLTIRLWKSANISGTIVDEAGEPVIGASVRLFRRTIVSGKPRLSPSSQATTDDRGLYRIPGLTPGDYLVGVLSTQSTMPATTSEAYIQQVMAGVSSINSEVYRDLTSSGAPSPSMGGTRVGDLILQTGMFGRSGGSAPAPTEDGRVLAYPTVFYPSAHVSSQATVLTVGSGEDRVGIDLHLKLQPTVRVSGTVMGPDGPARNLGVKLFPVGADEFTSESGTEAAMTATDANGQFTFLGVTPGQYTLKCLRVPRPTTSPVSMMTSTIEISGPNGMMMGMSSGGPSTALPPPLPTDLTVWATTTVNVGETDVAGLSVALRPGARISGRLVFEGTKDQPTPDQLQRASISITPVTGSGPTQLFSAAKRVEATGQFASVGYPPGRYLVTAFLPSLPPVPGAAPVVAGAAWRFKSATFGGRDVSDEGLVVEGDDISSLVITFTDRSTDVTGSVTDAKGQPDRSAIVVVIPADSEAWKQGNISARRTRSTRTTTTGAFSLGALPPGAYFIAAIADETLDNWQDPKTLEAITRVATRFTLGDGEKTNQTLITRILR